MKKNKYTYAIYKEVVGGNVVYCAYQRTWLDRLIRLPGTYIGSTLSYTVMECESKLKKYIQMNKDKSRLLMKEVKP